MTKPPRLYHRSPVTGSTADFLAGIYGNVDLETFATNLPKNARILDVGAGRSQFGQAICQLRPDIHWLNLDISYTKEQIADFIKDSPVNLQFVNKDILQAESFGSFDRIFCFWVLPLIGLEGISYVIKSLTSMQSLLTSTGHIQFGLLVAERTKKTPTHWGTTILTKRSSQTDIREAADLTILPPERKWRYMAVMRSGIATMKHQTRTGKKPTLLGLYDAANAEYIRVLTPIGFIKFCKNIFYLTTEYTKHTARSLRR